MASARRADSQGWRVFGTVRTVADGEALAAAAPGVEPLLLDVTDAASVAAAVQQVSFCAMQSASCGPPPLLSPGCLLTARYLIFALHYEYWAAMWPNRALICCAGLKWQAVPSGRMHRCPSVRHLQWCGPGSGGDSENSCC